MAAEGAQQIISVNGPAFVQVSSSDSTIATFTKMDSNVAAVTAAAGDADLILADGSGTEIDRVTVHVAAVGQLDFQQGWSGSSPLILENVPITIAPITKRDAGARILLGSGAVHFVVSGNLMSLGPTPPVSASAPQSVIESLVIEGAAGAGDLTATNGTATFDMPVTVVSLTDISKLEAESVGSVLGSGGASVDTGVSVTASTDSGAVYGAACAWAVSDSTVEVVITDTTDQLDRPAVGGVTFKMTKQGSFTATCTLGRLSTIIQLKRDS